MTDLSARLKRALEARLCEFSIDAYNAGIADENARLAPLHEKLVELARIQAEFVRKFSPGDDWYPEMGKALSALTQELEKMEERK